MLDSFFSKTFEGYATFQGSDRVLFRRLPIATIVDDGTGENI